VSALVTVGVVYRENHHMRYAGTNLVIAARTPVDLGGP
jgi:hypothetical protein